MQIITITGPSCSGKNRLLTELLATGLFRRIISDTSRPMRTGEVQGSDYYFKSKEEIREGIKNGLYVDHVNFKGHLYGIRKEELDGALTGSLVTNQMPIMIVEPTGVRNLLDWCNENSYDVYSIHLTAPVTLLVSRYLERARHDLFNDIEYSSERICNILHEFQTWPKAMYDLGVKFTTITSTEPEDLRNAVTKIVTTIGVNNDNS